jgi:hypothetical protein
MKELSLRPLVFMYLNNNPKSKIKDLRKAFKGEKENSLRTYLGQWRKQSIKKDISDISQKRSDTMKGRKLIPPLTPDGSDHLTADIIEQAILLAMSENPSNPSIIRAAVDFYSKVRATESEVREIDMSKFFLIGDDNPDS